MIIMLSLGLTSLYHIVRAAGRFEGVGKAKLQILLLQLLIGVKLLFLVAATLGVIEFVMVDRHPMKDVFIAASARHKQEEECRFQRALRRESRRLLLAQWSSQSPLCAVTCVKV